MIVYTTYLSNRGLINHDDTYEINIMRYPRYISKDKNSRHYPDLSPSGELLNKYKQKKINFDTFKKEFPDRFINCGIAEANMISTAAGLATCGKTVFASTFAIFKAKNRS